MATVSSKKEIINILKHYTDELRKEIHLEQLYLFGSYVSGTANSDSDIDVLIVSSDFSDDIMENQMLLRRIRRKIDLRIEPHPVKTEDLEHSVLFSMIKDKALKLI